jgi:hypothetical protein
MRNLAGALAVLGLLVFGMPVQAGDVVVPFHATLQVNVDCGPSCQELDAWVAACQAQGYDSGFQAVRTGHATLMGRVTSFEQGCLDFPEAGPGALVRSYVQLTLTARNGDTLTSFATVLFDFAQDNAPATGTFSITGGTGRFAGARGSGTLGNVKGGGNPGWIIYQDGSLRLSGDGH